MNLEEFKKRYGRELKDAYNEALFHAISAELNRILGDWKFIRKYQVIADQVRKRFDELLPRAFETYKREGIERALSEIGLIGLNFTLPNLKKLGLHREKRLPKLLEEYGRLYKSLKTRIKSKYRNPPTKKLNLTNLLTRELNLDEQLLKDHVKKWVDWELPLSQIALNALSLKYNASPSTIKNRLSKERSSKC